MQNITCADPESFVIRGPIVMLFFLLFFFSWWGEGGSRYHYKRAIIGPPAKCHLNGVSLVCWWWPNIECWLYGSFVIFRGSRPVLLQNPIFLWFFRGGGQDPLSPPPPPPLDPHMQNGKYSKYFCHTECRNVEIYNNMQGH